jgi:hypothetical protein
METGGSDRDTLVKMKIGGYVDAQDIEYLAEKYKIYGEDLVHVFRSNSQGRGETVDEWDHALIGGGLYVDHIRDKHIETQYTAEELLS